MATAGVVDVHHRSYEFQIRETKTRRTRNDLSLRSDQRVAVVDHSPRLVPEHVRVYVTDTERARAFQHQPIADRVLAKREMAGARVQDDIDRLQGEFES